MVAVTPADETKAAPLLPAASGTDQLPSGRVTVETVTPFENFTVMAHGHGPLTVP